MAARQPQMRVLVAEGSLFQLRADGRQRLEVRGLRREPVPLSRLRVSVRAGGLQVESPELEGRRPRRVSSLTVHSSDPRGIWLGQRRYGGVVHLMVRDGRIQAVNHLGIETYLASVVGSEMPEAWPLAALQAQAVAARTYALRQRGRKGAFDVKATVASQVYQGLESATPRTREAVNTTRALVMVHGGKLINAVFHSSSGGATEPSGEVWRHQLPYLVSVRDHDQQSPVHRWQKHFDARQLRAAFRETGGLQELDVLQTSSTGRLRSVRVKGPAGALVLSGSELRQRLGLKSTMVSFNWLAQAGRSDIPGASHRSRRVTPLERKQSALPGPVSTGPVSTGPALIGLWRDTATGSAQAASPSAVPFRAPVEMGGQGFALLVPPPPLPPSTTPSFKPLRATRPISTLPRPGMVLEVQGQGFGHGVGMSQWGARGLAEQGADFRQILEHYYRGVTIRPFLPVDDPAMAVLPPVRPAWNS